MVILECIPPFSDPSPFIFWKKDGSFFQPPDNAAVSMHGSLYLLGVTKEDEGYYECSAINIVTGTLRSSRKAHLFVTGNSECEKLTINRIKPKVSSDHD